jgi:hypothetical protein
LLKKFGIRRMKMSPHVTDSVEVPEPQGLAQRNYWLDKGVILKVSSFLIHDLLVCSGRRKKGPVRRNAALKESSREKSHVRRARFNGRPKLPGWPGKGWCSPRPGRAVAFIEGEGKEVSACAVVSGRGGAVLECRNLFKGGAAILADSQNGDMIVLPFRHFFFNNDEGRG